MSYQALYRAYRPQKFKDIVGQDVIVRTLQQAIKTSKISHAYLFSGPRGTGKTSVARILAKSINCQHNEKGEPCQACQHCLDITNGNHPDVIEIDAASNNGVDEIRDIRDKVKFLPGLITYKVYIIDEVHMLSQGAFNALLKTLEEPPKHVVFILATTEPHKIPATILSRCQRFDFKSITISELVNKLHEVVRKENLKIDEEAIITIAENAEGGMRDALSILDQAISFSSEAIDIEDVYAITGAVSTEKIIMLANFFEEKNITSALQTVGELLDLGKEATKLVNNMLQFYRDCLLYKNADTEKISKFIFEKKEFQDFANTITEEKIMYYVNILSDVSYKIRFSNSPRVYLDVAFMQMINMDTDQLKNVKRIEELEHKVESLALGGNVTSGGSYTEVDESRLSTLELRLSKVVNQLSKLELHKVIKKVDSLEERLNFSLETNEGVQSSGEDVSSEISLIKEQLNKLHAADNSEKTNNSDFGIEINSINKEITALKSSLEEIKTAQTQQQSLENFDVELVKLRESFTEIKDKIASLSNKINEEQPENKETKHNNIIERLDDLEDKLYKLIAGTLQAQTSSVLGKQTKSQAKQIALFGTSLIDHNELWDREDEDKTSSETSQLDDESQEEKISKTEETIEPVKYIDTTEKLETETKQPTETIETANKKPEEVVAESTKANVEKTIEKTASEPTSISKSTPKSSVTKVEVFGEVSDIESVNVKETKADLPKRSSGEYSTFDERLIERILHDSQTVEARKDRAIVLENWRNLDRGVDPELISVAELLKEADVGAVGKKQIIILYDTASTVNQVMRPRFKARALRVLDHALNLDIKYYMALPKDTWVEKRKEYINQYNIGIKYPTLQPINNPELYEIGVENDYIDDRQKSINKTIEIFGEDLVKVK